jgi:hypothetical protein
MILLYARAEGDFVIYLFIYIYILIYSLFNATVSNSDTALNGRITTE